MALPYKQGKIALVLREMNNTGSEYEINGIDLDTSVFMWRKTQETYTVIPTSSYSISESSNGNTLVITDTETLSEIERLQIVYIINNETSTYDPSYKVDVTTLKDHYNTLVESFSEMFEYIKKTVIVADGQDYSIVLPTLNEGEVWVKTEDSWRGFYIGDIEIQVKELRKLIENSRVSAIRDIENKRDSSLESIKEEGTTQVNKVKTTGDAQNTRITKTGTSQNLLVLEQGNTQNTRLIAQGNTQNTRIIDTGNTQNTRITNTGDAQNTRILDQGDTQSNRLNAIDNQVSTKFDLMQRMMSVVVGANRWLDGGNIELRDISLSPERTADGGDIRQRIGNPRRIYDAGDITQRVVDIPLDIDLGTK